ncbi:MAG: efflux transporter outer membrane subunit [Candidatus Omnitrophica bacterium]|nr:efflux transporter outer membrane subunit [Candidatus Omnitrophota bacterium]
MSDTRTEDQPAKRPEKASLSRVCLLIAALFVPGCTMIPKYERPAAPVPSQYPGVTGANENRSAEIPWKDFFAEKRLKRLVELALANNRDLRAATLRVEQIRAQYRITRSALFPTVDANGNFTRSKSSLAGFPQGNAGSGGSSSFTLSQWSASLGSTAYEVDLWGRVRSLNRQALEDYFATEEARRSVQISLMAEVAIQYFALREAEEQLKVANQTLVAVEDSYKLNKAAFEAGANNELDLRTSEGQVQTARINMVAYQRQLAQAQDALALLLGRTLPANLPAPGPFLNTNLLSEIPAGLPSELIERRPDILQAEHVLKAANANIGAARAAFFPAITLTAAIGSTSSELSELFSGGTGVWNFSPQITLPIFTGGRNLASLESAKVGKRIEIANYEKAIQTAFSEVADALVANSTFAQQIKDEGALVVTQQRRYELATARYREGEDSYLNVLSAQQDLYSAQQGLLQARFNKLASQVSLYEALGGGWQ